MMFSYETQCNEMNCIMAASPYFKDMIMWMDSRIEIDVQGKEMMLIIQNLKWLFMEDMIHHFSYCEFYE